MSMNSGEQVAQHGHGTKCAENSKPKNNTSNRIGVNRPYIGQNEILKNIKDNTPRAVDVGIILGQYISHGIVTLATIGNHSVKYKMMPIFATSVTMAKFKVILQS